MKYLSLLAFAIASLVSAQDPTPIGKNFTVNLLTDDDSLSVVKLPADGGPGISRKEAVNSISYDNTMYSIVGTFFFTDFNAGQSFNINNDLWHVNINMSLVSSGEFPTDMGQDVVVGKKEGADMEFGFVYKPAQIPGVNFKMDQSEYGGNSG